MAFEGNSSAEDPKGAVGDRPGGPLGEAEALAPPSEESGPHPSKRTELVVKALADRAGLAQPAPGSLRSLGGNVAQRPLSPSGISSPILGPPAAGSQPNRPPPVTMHIDDIDVRKVLEMLSRDGGVNILVSPGVTGRVTADLRNLDFHRALDAVLRLCNLVARWEDDVLFVYSPQEMPQRERIVRTFPLDYTSGTDASQSVQALLSPVGQAFVTETLSTDNRKAREFIVVEDLPEHLRRIEQHIADIDRPPRQVLIEVHVLAVELDDEKKHGVDFQHIMSWLNNTVELTLNTTGNPLTQGFAMPAPLGPGFYVNVDGTGLNALVECLKTTTDAKTLASPRVLVINGQEARIQIGERFGYRITRVTETAAIEDVKFLDTGVVLTVTPRISRDNRVMMRVKPQVSDGSIDPDTELPEEETTEVETDVLLASGRGIVIGGLIQERDSNIQSKIPWLGDLWLVGLAFQHREVKKIRSEIIITLMPRVLPYQDEYVLRNEVDTNRAGTPLLEGPLNRYPRPWEPSLPDAVYNPRTIRPCPRRAAYPPQSPYLEQVPQGGFLDGYESIPVQDGKELPAGPHGSGSSGLSGVEELPSTQVVPAQ